MEVREHMKSFVSGPIMEAAREAAIKIGEKIGQLERLELHFGDNNPLYISDKEERLKIVLTRFVDDEGRAFFLGYTEE